MLNVIDLYFLTVLSISSTLSSLETMLQLAGQVWFTYIMSYFLFMLDIQYLIRTISRTLDKSMNLTIINIKNIDQAISTFQKFLK